jgi:outer membrane protein insertion porin family
MICRRFNLFCWLALALGFWFSQSFFSLRAATLDVVEIRIEGLERVSEKYVLGHMASRVGAAWKAGTVERDVARLYATGRFESVEIVDEVSPEGIRLIVKLIEASRIVHVYFEGLQALKRYDIVRSMREEGFPEMPLKREDVWLKPLNRAFLSDILSALEKVAHKKNFTDITVVSRTEKVSGGVDLILTVDEGYDVFVDDFSITSESGFSESFIEKQARLTTKEKIFIFRSGIFEPDFLADDILKVKYFFRDRGFLDVTIDATVTRDTVSPGWWGRLFGRTTEDAVSIHFTVKEGPLYSWGEISFEGGQQFSKEELKNIFALQSGEEANTRHLFDARDRLQEAYGNLGYLPEGDFPDPVLTRIDIRRYPDARTKTVDLEIHIREGQKITIRDLIIRGNERTRDEVIRRQMLAILPGSIYHWGHHQEALRLLKNLDYFKAVDRLDVRVSPEFGKIERDLILEVEEKDTGGLNFGVSVSSEGDFNLNFAINQSNFDVTDLPGFPGNIADFFRARQYVGKGQNFSLNLSPGTRRSRYQVSLYEPWFLGYPFALGSSVSLRKDESFRDYEQERLLFTLTASKRWYLGPESLVTLGLRYRHEDVAIIDVDDNAPDFIKDTDPDTSVRGLMPFFSYDSRDNIFFPSRGQMHEISLERAGGIFGGLDFTRISQKSSFYFTSWVNREDEKHVLSFTSRLDWIEAFGDTTSIPINERYFLGGLRTLRGFEFAGVGPQEDDVPRGGVTRHYGSLEYIVPLSGRAIRGVTFFDYGTLHQENPGDWINNYRFSLGLGLRIHVPGVNIPLSFEVAEPVGPKPHGDKRQFFNFSFQTRTSF